MIDACNANGEEPNEADRQKEWERAREGWRASLKSTSEPETDGFRPRLLDYRGWSLSLSLCGLQFVHIVSSIVHS